MGKSKGNEFSRIRKINEKKGTTVMVWTVVVTPKPTTSTTNKIK